MNKSVQLDAQIYQQIFPSLLPFKVPIRDITSP
jgi:hypothetical protein